MRALLYFFLITLTFAFLTCRGIDLTTADLGRHLANGNWILQSVPEVLSTNFFSYTQPSFPFVNHHWGSGVIFYLVHAVSGFEGLSILYMILGVATIFLGFEVARKSTSDSMALWLTLLILPLITYRTEVRPEIFTYFFSAGLYFILWRWKTGSLPTKWLALLPLGFLFWANLHIYFVIGWFILGCHLLELVAHPAERPRALALAWTFGGSIVACLINPIGPKLLLQPFTIFNNYGYKIVENQSIPFFLERRMWMPPFSAYFLLSIAVVFVVGWSIREWKSTRWPIAALLSSTALGLMGFLAIRNLGNLAYLALPIMGELLDGSKKSRWPVRVMMVLALASVGNSLLSFDGLPRGPRFGLLPEVNASAEFFKRENLTGPIFNNYDIGGFLIYHLFPEEKVFVDNRPEAYPSEFLSELYVPMQESPEKWQAALQKYQFNALFFNWHDFTPAGQTFLIARIQDPDWAPVFVDSYALILLRRNEKNAATIHKFELPKELFRVRRNGADADLGTPH